MTYTGWNWCQMCGNPMGGVLPPPAMRQWAWICDDCMESMWLNPEKWGVL